MFAQDADELTLSVRRDWGFGGGSQIQGLFTMEVLGPENPVSVTFMIDNAAIGEVTGPPFKLQFDTDDYPTGWHDLIAVGRTADGRQLTSAPRRLEFVSADCAWSVAQRILLNLGGFLGLLIIVMIMLQTLPSLLGTRTTVPLGAPRNYGLMGGAVCPKCQRPFAIHWWSFNVGFQKYDRCDRCGKWSLVNRARREQLAAAEAAELAMARPETPVAEMTPEDKLKRELDESRYVDERNKPIHGNR